MKAKIESIKISIGDKTIELTLEEAKELKNALDELIPAPKKIEPSYPENIDWDEIVKKLPKAPQNPIPTYPTFPETPWNTPYDPAPFYPSPIVYRG